MSYYGCGDEYVSLGAEARALTCADMFGVRMGSSVDNLEELGEFTVSLSIHLVLPLPQTLPLFLSA